MRPVYLSTNAMRSKLKKYSIGVTMQLYHNNYSENKNAIITVRNTGFN
jgi:hypothetical protein